MVQDVVHQQRVKALPARDRDVPVRQAETGPIDMANFFFSQKICLGAVLDDKALKDFSSRLRRCLYLFVYTYVIVISKL